MLCNVCHKNIATVHLTEIINAEVTEIHLCQVCARHKTEELKGQLSVFDLLGGLSQMGKLKKEEVSLKCSFCGLAYKEFKRKGRLGCGNCYTTFKHQLLPILKNIHGATQHTGKFPLSVRRKETFRTKIKELRKRLERAIGIEEYEEAASLRDEIRKLEKRDV
ncbi:MAG: UvrB/UvrC motif-containing protein [Candidatus Omnitrophica bacterium]|nr:UvrB/UvrC motif-containing protein [Candidatus Omnitrophota bacterium]MBU0896447.1 UvrB/UvrC motif-containing protein [Candidatus Omnitrophota bacterium]MBU1366482.1 UvrB/UvrC motif-containing protein [Candidatus Omnitrophota bacterium]MBU1524665.1 UvrB/UvrC motif-containing protein [Candidatus Omnitrophota bacterium]MBU1810979.1 UvrB/UvrC motif-containing protein [Candidatus Omnitrophota bacterium]